MKENAIKEAQVITNSLNFFKDLSTKTTLKTKYKINDWKLWNELVQKYLAQCEVKPTCLIFKKYCQQIQNFNQKFDLNNVLAFYHYLDLLSCKQTRKCQIETDVYNSQSYKLKQQKLNNNHQAAPINQARAEKDIVDEQELLEDEFVELSPVDGDDEIITESAENDLIQEDDDDHEDLYEIIINAGAINENLNLHDQVQLEDEQDFYSQHNIFKTSAGSQKQVDSIQAILNDVGKYGNIMSSAQEQVLFKQYQHGSPRAKKRAYDKLILRNWRLAVANAKAFRARGMDFDDVLMEATFGIIEGIKRFDPERGFKFSTYANPWIRQAISRAIINKVDLVKIPINVREQLSRIIRHKNQWVLLNQCEPSPEELSNYIKATSDEVIEPQRISELLLYNRKPVSLDKKIGSDEEDNISHFIADEGINPVEFSDESTFVDYLHQLLNDSTRFDVVEQIYLALTYRLDLAINDRFKIIQNVIHRADLERLISAEDKAYVISFVLAAKQKFHFSCPCATAIINNQAKDLIKKMMAKCKKTIYLKHDQIKWWIRLQMAHKYDQLFSSLNSKELSFYKKYYLSPYEMDPKLSLSPDQVKIITYQCPIWTRDRLKPIERKIKIKIETLKMDPKLQQFAWEKDILN